MSITRNQIPKANISLLVFIALGLAVGFLLLNILAAYLSQWVPIAYGAIVISHAMFIVVMSMYAMDSSLFKTDRVLPLEIGKCALLTIAISVVYVTSLLALNSYAWAILTTWGVISFSFFVPSTLLGKNASVPSDKTMLLFWTEKWKQILAFMAPVLAVLVLIRFPEEACTRECWGLFEGGIITIP